VLVLFLVVIGVVRSAAGTGNAAGRTGGLSAAQLREYANRLKASGLAVEAAEAYEAYVRKAAPDGAATANIYFTVGEMYLNTKRYEDALAYFIKAETAFSDTPLKKDIGAHMVTCLERLGKDLDAEYELESRASLKSERKTKTYPGEIVASIGMRDITMGELNAEIEALPSWLKEIVGKDEASKMRFLEQYVAHELLFEKGEKLGYAKEPEMREQLERMRRELVIQRVVQEEIQGKVDMDPEDLSNYYEAHKDQYTEEPEEEGGQARQLTFEEAAERVAVDYRRGKEERLSQQLLGRLLLTKNVKVYREKFNIEETAESVSLRGGAEGAGEATP